MSQYPIRQFEDPFPEKTFDVYTSGGRRKVIYRAVAM